MPHNSRRNVYVVLKSLPAFGFLLAMLAVAAPLSAEARPLNVVIVMGGLKNDGGFNQYAAEAAAALEKQGEIKFRIRESVTTPANAEPIFRQFAAQGYDLVIGWGLSYSDSIFKVAKEIPKAHFVATGSNNILTRSTDNVETWTFATDQMGYLTGWVAGKTGRSPVAVVEGQSAPFEEVIYKYMAAGLKAANPAAKQLKTIFTGSWEDPQLGSQAAKAQIDLGAQLIVTGSEGYTSGVVSAAKAGGIVTIGASNAVGRNAMLVNIGLVKLDLTPALQEMVQRLRHGTFGHKGYLATIGNKGLVFGDVNAVQATPPLPGDLREEADRLAANLASGSTRLPDLR